MADKPTKPTKPRKPKTDAAEVVDPFAYLFAGYDGTASKAKLIRVEPEEWRGVSIKGYICDIDPSMDENWIKTNHGGGKYQLMKISIGTGKIEAARYMDISGNPLVADPISLPAAGGAPALFEPVEIDIDGAKVPYNGNLHEITKFVITMKSIAQAFPVKPDINDTLLTLLLAKADTGGGDMFEQITKMKAAADLFGNDKGNTGAGTADIVNNAITQAGKILGGMAGGPKAITAPPLRSRPGVMPVNRPVATGNNGDTIDSIDTEKTPGADIGPDTETQTEEVQTMSTNELLFSIARQLVTNFSLEIPIPPDRTVRMIDQVLRQESHIVRQSLQNNYGDLVKDFAIGELGEIWADPDTKIGSREEFEKWCDEIWKIYADSERQVVLV